MKLWNARTSQDLRTLHGHTAGIRSVTISADGQMLASGSQDNTVKLWDARTGQELRTLRGHTSSVNSVTFSTDGHILASGSDDNTVKLWNPRTGQEIRALRGHTAKVSSVTFSPDGQVVASGSNTVKLWDARTGQEIRALRGLTMPVTSVTFSPDGEMVASASQEGTVRLWDPHTGHEIDVFREKRNLFFFSGVSFSPDGKVVATASSNQTVTLWDTRTGRQGWGLLGHTNMVSSVAFNPDGQILASGSHDNTVILWDVRTGREIRSLRGHTGSVESVAFSPDGQFIASASHDKTVKLWDTRTRQDMRVLLTAMLPDPAEHRHLALQADQEKQSFAAACRLGHGIAARLRLQPSPWDPAAGRHGLDEGRKAQTVFVDGPTFAGILLKDSSRSAKGLVLRAQWAVDQWPEGWHNRELLGGALYRDGDYKGAVRELMESQKLRGQNRSSNPQPTVWSCHFLTLAHHKVGNKNDAAAWRAKAVLPKDANWEDAMIDRYLRREVEAELGDQKRPAQDSKDRSK